MSSQHNPIIMEEIAESEAPSEARQQWEMFDRNWKWFLTHAAEIYDRARGKHLFVAGQEVFIAETPEDAIAKAKASHPEDHGGFILSIPRERMFWIYGHRG